MFGFIALLLLFSVWGLEVHVVGQGRRDGRDAVSLSLHPLTFPFSRNGSPTAVLLPGKSHGQESLVGFNPWGRTRLDI